MAKTPCHDNNNNNNSNSNNGLKKGPWTPEEDQILIDYIKKHGHGKWRTIPKSSGLRRCGKSCRLRWTNYLRPDIKRGKYTLEEEDTIIQLHSILGNKWSAIAARLPGRTDNEIKNYWNTHIRKRLMRMGIDPATHKPSIHLLQLYAMLNNVSILHNSLHQPFYQQTHGLVSNDSPVMDANLQALASSLTPFQSPSPPQPSFPQNLHHQNNIRAFQDFQAQTAPTSSPPSFNSITLDEHFQLQGEMEQSSRIPTNPSFGNPYDNNDVGQRFVHEPGRGCMNISEANQCSLFPEVYENQVFHSNIDIASLDFDIGSIVAAAAAPSSYSNTTYGNNNGSTEEERESYCSDTMFDGFSITSLI